MEIPELLEVKDQPEQRARRETLEIQDSKVLKDLRALLAIQGRRALPVFRDSLVLTEDLANQDLKDLLDP